MKKQLPLLITGAAGFIGACFVKACIRREQPCIAVDESMHFINRLEHREIKFETIIDRKNLFDFLWRERPKLQAIIHLGACTDTTEWDEAFLKKTNLEYSKEIWRFSTKHKIPLVYASSAATYGDGGMGYDDEEALIQKLRPLNPYGQSKQDFDLWALQQEQEGHAPPTWSGFKFFNVYGFGERHKNKMASVVLHAFDQIRKTGQVRLFKSHKHEISDGHQKRDFVFLSDVIDVLLFALEKPIKRGIFNLGSGKARTFLDLVTCVFNELSLSPKIEFIDTPLEIRERYQYFTQATMHKLRFEGYLAQFTPLEKGVGQYIRQLLA